MGRLYVGIDLHSNNCLIVILNGEGNVIYQKRLANDLAVILGALTPHQPMIEKIAVESTYNWYWLVDGLMEAGYAVDLVNTAAVKQYEGLKYTDDTSDARWLANLLRLGVLPVGYIYPKKERGVRDLLRKRSQLVQQKTAHILSIENLLARNLGECYSSNKVKQLTCEKVKEMFDDPNLALAITSNVTMMRALGKQAALLQRSVQTQVKLRKPYQMLLTVPGIGTILGLTIMLETGEISRFNRVGDFASYCRCVGSVKTSNRKKKGEGNRKNGNKYLSWAFVEAANFAVRFDTRIRRYHDRKKAKTNKCVAIKAVAHKLARACYYILRDQTAFEVNRAFA
jgi:transposase